MGSRFWEHLTAVTVALCASCAVQASTAGAARRGHAAGGVPQRFVGVNVDGPMLAAGDDLDLAGQFATMAASGVRSVRVAFSWAAAQPYPTWREVPASRADEFTDAAGIPTDFATTDRVVGLAAQAHLTVLAVVLGAPAWDARTRARALGTPARTGPYAGFLTALVKRYGPRGSYWTGHRPTLPIRKWQIWNEPNIAYYWPQPFAARYVALLRAAHAAIKRADPGASVVLGALTNYSWSALRQIYAIRGARRTFDVIAVDPYTARPTGVTTILTLVRHVADAFGGARVPMIASEVGWTSAVGHHCRIHGWDTTQAGQARRIAALLPSLAANRAALRLIAFYDYTWMGDESEGTYDFSFAGLVRFANGAVSKKPALRAFAAAAHRIER